MLLLSTASMLVVITGPAANAQEYTGTCTITVSDLQPHPGDVVTVTGDHFPLIPNTVPIMIDNPSQQIGTAHIDASGHFSDEATIPSELAPGTHTISVACATTHVDSTVVVEVLGEEVSTSTSPLARTGSDPQPLVLVGLGAVAVGTALVLTARRRRAQRLAA